MGGFWCDGGRRRFRLCDVESNGWRSRSRSGQALTFSARGIPQCGESSNCSSRLERVVRESRTALLIVSLIICTAVCHDILEFSARVLDAGLSSCAVARFPFASSRERNARSSKDVLDHAHSTQIGPSSPSAHPDDGRYRTRRPTWRSQVHGTRLADQYSH